MPGAVRKPDLDSAGCSNITSSNDTYVNTLQLTRYDDVRTSLCEDVGITIDGAEVYCNNRHVQFVGHSTTCPTIQIEGSSNVIVN